MISAFTGTPGSGKSLHAAKEIYEALKHCRYKKVVCNMEIKKELFTKEQQERFQFVENMKLTVPNLWQIGEEWYQSHMELPLSKREKCILLVIDECQTLFNAREWGKNSKAGWPEFFSLHRHVGYQIILVTQMLEALDKQVRGLVEFETTHYKARNMGLPGAMLHVLALGGLFRAVTYWTPKNERVYAEFFKYRRVYGELYDTHAFFLTPEFLERAEDIKKEHERRYKKRA